MMSLGLRACSCLIEHEGLTRASVTTTAASATIYLHGAQPDPLAACR